MLILKDEHAIDVLKSGNTGHLWHDFHAIGVHATDVGHPDKDDDDGVDEDGLANEKRNLSVSVAVLPPSFAPLKWDGGGCGGRLFLHEF